MKSATIPRAVLSQQEAIDYVHGETIFHGLITHHPAIMRPLTQAANNRRTWLRSTLDTALAAAHAAQTFIHPPTRKPSQPCRRPITNHQ